MATCCRLIGTQRFEQPTLHAQEALKDVSHKPRGGAATHHLYQFWAKSLLLVLGWGIPTRWGENEWSWGVRAIHSRKGPQHGLASRERCCHAAVCFRFTPAELQLHSLCTLTAASFWRHRSARTAKHHKQQRADRGLKAAVREPGNGSIHGIELYNL